MSKDENEKEHQAQLRHYTTHLKSTIKQNQLIMIFKMLNYFVAYNTQNVLKS